MLTESSASPQCTGHVINLYFMLHWMALKREIFRTSNLPFPYTDQFEKRCENNRTIRYLDSSSPFKIMKERDGNILPGSGFFACLFCIFFSDIIFFFRKLKVASVFKSSFSEVTDWIVLHCADLFILLPKSCRSFFRLWNSSLFDALNLIFPAVISYWWWWESKYYFQIHECQLS